VAKNKKQTKAALVKRLSEVRIVEIACKSVDISRATLYRWLKEDVVFASNCQEAIMQGTETISDLAESQIVTKIKLGELKASTYWLEHHHRDYKPPRREPKTRKELFSEEPMREEDIDLLIKTLEALKEADKKN
jgi:hypothetical protein